MSLINGCKQKPVCSLGFALLLLIMVFCPVGVWAGETPQRPLPQDPVSSEGYRLAIENGTRTADGRPGDAYWQVYSRYKLHVTLDPQSRLLSGTAEITWINRSPQPTRQLHLELVQNLHAPGVRRNRPAEITGGMELHQVQVDDRLYVNQPGEPFRYQITDTRMIVWLADAILPGDSAVVRISYEFAVPERGAAGRMGHSRDNLFYLGYWYPHMAVFDDVVGWHTDPYLGQAEFYHGFADYQLSIRVPEGWLVMATGELQNAQAVLHEDIYRRLMQARESDEPMRVYTSGEDIGPTRSSESGDGWLTWEFMADNVRDVAFSATRSSHWDAARTSVGDLNGDGETDYTVLNTFYREEAPLWSEVTAYQQHAITFLSQMTGFSYPWPHMTAVEGAGIIGGGMEYPMMTVMGDYNRAGAEALYSVTAHELAHMWIPLIVSTDERRYSWFDEGNTVFSTSEAFIDRFADSNPHLQSMQAYRQAAMRGGEGPMMRRSDFHYTGEAFIVASYRKPAAVLNALRKVLGEDVFWEAYRTFVNEWAFKQAYPWDFFSTFERVSGEDLGWFWYSWYYTTWVLNQAVEAVEQTSQGTRVVVRDHGEVPMPVYLTVTTSDGEETKYTVPVTMWLEGNRRIELFVPRRDVVRVEIDAGRQLPDINRENMVWEQSVH